MSVTVSSVPSGTAIIMAPSTGAFRTLSPSSEFTCTVEPTFMPPVTGGSGGAGGSGCSTGSAASAISSKAQWDFDTSENSCLSLSAAKSSSLRSRALFIILATWQRCSESSGPKLPLLYPAIQPFFCTAAMASWAQ